MPRRIPGPAAVGTMNMPAQDADEMLRIIDRSSLQDVDVRHIVEMTLWKLRERGTGIAIVAWIAELDTKEDPRGWNSTDTDGDFLLTRGSFRIGVFCEKRRRSPTVDRLGEHYKDRLNDILARNY
jgi:hypothetical protein